MKEAVKKSAGSSGIMTINKNIAADVDKLLQKYLNDARQQGVDLETLSPEQLKMIVQMNKPQPPKVYSGQAAVDELNKLFPKKGEVVEFPQKRTFKEEIEAMKKSGDIVDPNNLKKNDKVTQRDMFKDSNLNKEGTIMDRITTASNRIKQIQKEQDEMYRPKTDAEIKAKFDKQNKDSVKNIKNNRQLTDEEIRDYELELGDSETWLNKGTFGEAEQALKNQKAYEAKMFAEYKSIGGSKRPDGPNASKKDSLPIRLMKNFEKELNEADLMAEGYSKDQANVLIKARQKMISGEEMNPNESLLRVKEEFADKAGVDVDNFTDIDFEIDIPEYAKGGRARFQQGGLPAIDSRMNLDYNTLVEQNTDPMLQALKTQNTSSYRAPTARIQPTPEGTMGPINLDNFEPQNTNPPTERILPMPTPEGTMGPISLDNFEPQNRNSNNEKKLIERSQPGSLEQYLSGYEKYKSTNPNRYMGTQALIDATLPGGIDYTFNSSSHANHFNDYLESIGLSPYQKNLNAISNAVFDSVKFNKGGRAGFYTGGITDVEPSLDDIGHGADAMNARTRLMSPGNQATTSTGLNYLLAEDNDNMRIPFAAGGGDPKRRAFLKLMATLTGGAAAFKSGLLSLGEGGTKKAVTETVKQAAGSGGQVPPYFLKLVSKIKTLGDDVTPSWQLKTKP